MIMNSTIKPILNKLYEKGFTVEFFNNYTRIEIYNREINFRALVYEDMTIDFLDKCNNIEVEDFLLIAKLIEANFSKLEKTAKAVGYSVI